MACHRIHLPPAPLCCEPGREPVGSLSSAAIMSCRCSASYAARKLQAVPPVDPLVPPNGSYEKLRSAKAFCHFLCRYACARGDRHQRPAASIESQNGRTFAFVTAYGSDSILTSFTVQEYHG